MRNRSSLPSLFRYLFFVMAVSALITEGLWLISISEDTIKKAINSALGDKGMGIEINGFKKGLFYNLSADKIVLKSDDRDIIYIDNVSVRINPFHLFLLRHKSSFDGRINSGRVSGDLVISRNQTRAAMKIAGVDIGDVPFLKAIGLKGKGLLDADIIVRDSSVSMKFDMNDAGLDTFSFSGIDLPVEVFNKLRGAIRVDGQAANIDSLSMEGDGIYGRIKGSIKDGVVDLSFEIMPDASAMDKFPMLAFLERYKVSPGYYVIPIKTKIQL